SLGWLAAQARRARDHSSTEGGRDAASPFGRSSVTIDSTARMASSGSPDTSMVRGVVWVVVSMPFTIPRRALTAKDNLSSRPSLSARGEDKAVAEPLLR